MHKELNVCGSITCQFERIKNHMGDVCLSDCLWRVSMNIFLNVRILYGQPGHVYSLLWECWPIEIKKGTENCKFVFTFLFSDCECYLKTDKQNYLQVFFYIFLQYFPIHLRLNNNGVLCSFIMPSLQFSSLVREET